MPKILMRTSSSRSAGDLNSKEIVRKLFLGQDIPRIPFIPWLYWHAAKVEQISTRDMSTDPGKLSRALQNAWKLYGYDAVVIPFDLSLEAEACGAELFWVNDNEPPHTIPVPHASFQTMPVSTAEPEQKTRLPVVLESIRRLKIILGHSVPLVTVVAGPLSIASRLLSTDIIEALNNKSEDVEKALTIAGNVAARICKVYCELGPQILAIADEHILRLPNTYATTVSATFRTIGNVARFFNAHPILITKAQGNESLEITSKLNMDGIAVGGEADPADMRRLRDSGLVIGIGIPLSQLSGSSDKLLKFINYHAKGASRRKFFLCTDWEVPYETSPDMIHTLIRAIADFDAPRG